MPMLKIDFLTDYKSIVIPMEVKSADNTKAKSLNLFIQKYKPSLAFKFSMKNYGDSINNNTKIYSIPLYFLFKFKKYVQSN